VSDSGYSGSSFGSSGFGNPGPGGNGTGDSGYSGSSYTGSTFGSGGPGGNGAGDGGFASSNPGGPFGGPGFGATGPGGDGFGDSGFGGPGPGGPGFGMSGQGSTGSYETPRQDQPWGDFGAQDLTRREPIRQSNADPARGGAGGTGPQASRDRGQQPAVTSSPADRIDGYLASRGRGAQNGPGDDRSWGTQGSPVEDRGRSPQGGPGMGGGRGALGGPGAGPDRGDMAARMDPALKDFFDPQTARPGAFPNPDRGPAADQAYRPAGGGPRPGGQPSQGTGPRSWDTQGPGRPGQPGGSRPWDAPSPSARPAAGPAAPGPRTARRIADDDAPAGRGRLYGLIGLIVVVVVLIGAYLVFHKSGGGSNAGNSTQPTVTASATTPAAKPSKTATAKTGNKLTGTLYTLSTPATAGGYPQGQDPHFLATATTTADAIRAAVVHAGAKVTGNPVSAAYQLPTFNQVMTFVGYQGTFDPTKVLASLAPLGATDVNKYSTGPHGGQFVCATAPGSAQATVCLWVTTSTLGITEFFSSTGPEVLTTHQDHGAAYALNLRNGVEAKKS
jgi:hypothetical protein